jgi:Ca-activated chloride channel family protein
MKVSDVYPHGIPDLFVGRPVILTGRYSGSGSTTITVSGSAGGRIEEMPVAAALDATGGTSAALPSVWARAKIAELSETAIYEGGGDFAKQIKDVALEFGLMSDYTAFVAVDSLTRTAAGDGTTVQVPVPVPEGVKYETTVQDGRTGAGGV